MAPPAKKLSSNGTKPYERDLKSKKNESVQGELIKLKEKSKYCPKIVAEESEDSSDEEYFDPNEVEDTEGDSEVDSEEDGEVDGEEEEDDGETDEEGNDDGKAKGDDKGADEDSSDDD